MKKQELMKRLRKIARSEQIPFHIARQGGKHEVHQFGTAKLTIPRHAEINERLARAILQQAEQEVG